MERTRVSLRGRGRCAVAMFAGASLSISAVTPNALAQVNLPALRVTGLVREGPLPFTWGSVQVITGTDKADFCGEGTPDAHGRYTVDIIARAPNCVRAHATDPPINYVFIAKGQRLGIIAEANASLDHPELLGTTRRLDLSLASIPGFGVNAPDLPAEGEILVARYWGQLMLANRPAPAGTVIDLALAGSAFVGGRKVTLTRCAQGQVVGKQGIYWIDLPITSSCVRETITSPPITLLFMVNGERVGSVAEAFAALNSVTTLGNVSQVNLQGVSPPP